MKLIPETARAWIARGPGWANSGVTMMARDEKTGREQSVTLYARHFDPTVLHIAAKATDRLEQEFVAAWARQSKRSKRPEGKHGK